MADNTAGNAKSGRYVSKKEANRAAAARVYIAASKKAGRPVPPSVQRLAAQGS
ncbi:hypothetical protein [Flexivirga sp.]|uniref:hypothetical protein n=1 Tax=Flexivirga sp. TaxID=1962927 RepID=UPI003F7FE298